MSSPSTAQDPPPRERRGLAELVRHTLNYGAVPLVHALLAFGMLPFYTEWLSEAQYGVIGLSDLILVVLAELLGTHLLSGMVRHYFVHEFERERNAVISSTTLAVMLLSWGVCGLALIFREPLTPILLGDGDHFVGPGELLQILTLTLIILPFQLTSQAGFGYLQALKRSQLHSGIKLAKMFLELGLKIWLIGFMGKGVLGFFISVLVGEILTAVLLTGWVLMRVGLRFDWKVLKPVLAFMAPLVPVGVCQLGLHQFDKRLLEAFSPEDEALTMVGIYGLGYLLARIANQLVLAPFFTIWQPWVFDEKDEGARAKLVGRVTTLAVTVIASASIGLMFFGYEAVQFLASRDGYKQAYKVIPWVTSGYVCWALYTSAQLPFLAARRTRPLMWINALALGLNIGLNLALIPRFGYMGCAAATLLTFAALALMAMGSSRLYAPVPFEWSRIGMVLLATAIAAVGVSLLDAELLVARDWSPWRVVPLKVACLSALLTVLWARVVGTDERKELVEWVRRRLGRTG